MAALSHQREEERRGEKKGKKSGKTQERQEIVHFARGAFNYLIAEWMHFPQLTLDVHLQREGQGGERCGGKGRGRRRIGRVLIKTWGGQSCRFCRCCLLKWGLPQCNGPAKAEQPQLSAALRLLWHRKRIRWWNEAQHPNICLCLWSLKTYQRVLL